MRACFAPAIAYWDGGIYDNKMIRREFVRATLEQSGCDLGVPIPQRDVLCRVAAVLTTVRAVNKTDSATMGADFGSLAAMFRASEQTLSTVPGLGPTKVKRLHNAFSTPFFRIAATAQAVPAAGGAVPVANGAATGRVAGVMADAVAPVAGRNRAHAGASHEAEDGIGEGSGDEEEGAALQATQEDREWLATQAAFVGAEDMAEEEDDDDFV